MIKRFGFTTALIFATVVSAIAQQFFYQQPLIPIPPPKAPQVIMLDLRPVWTKWSINFRDDLLSSSFQKTGLELGASIVSRAVSVRYSVIPSITFDEQMLPLDTIHIGDMDFGKKVESGDKAKPVDLRWSLEDSHRVEIAVDVGTNIRPLVLGKSVGFTLAATGENKDGKIATASETERRFFVGAGGVLENRTQTIDTRVLAVAGPQYTRFDASALYRVNPNIAVSGGYYTELLQFERTKIRNHGPFVGITGMWEF